MGVVRLKLVEAKDWTTDKLGRAQAGTVAVVLKGVQIAHSTTGRIIGQDRATYLFTSLYLPVAQPAVAAAKPITNASIVGDVPKANAGKLTELKIGGKITEANVAATHLNGAIVVEPDSTNLQLLFPLDV